jgi:hypothetical protein
MKTDLRLILRKNRDAIPFLRSILLAASGLFFSVPGLAAILKGLGAPPGYQAVFGGFVEALGALSMVLLILRRDKLREMALGRATKTSLVLCASSLFSLLVYLFLFNFCIVTHPTHGTVFFPLWTSGHLSEIVSRAGSRYAALDRYGTFPITSAVRNMWGYPLPMVVTVGSLLLSYQAIFTTLAIALAVVGLRPSLDHHPTKV